MNGHGESVFYVEMGIFCTCRFDKFKLVVPA